jgi:hypothetical protein
MKSQIKKRTEEHEVEASIRRVTFVIFGHKVSGTDFGQIEGVAGKAG